MQRLRLALSCALLAALTGVAVQAIHSGFLVATNGSDEVTGINTAWTADLSGHWLFTLPCREVYQFTFASPTRGVLDRPYHCATR